MASAFCAGNFRPAAICIKGFGNRPFNFIIETGPAAFRVKFGVRFVQGRPALFAGVSAVAFKIGVFSCKRPFCSFFNNYIPFKLGELPVFRLFCFAILFASFLCTHTQTQS